MKGVVLFEWRRGIKINVKALFLPRQAWLCGLEQNDVSNLVKKGYFGLVWLLVGFYLFIYFLKVCLLNWNFYVNVIKCV